MSPSPRASKRASVRKGNPKKLQSEIAPRPQAVASSNRELNERTPASVGALPPDQVTDSVPLRSVAYLGFALGQISGRVIGGALGDVLLIGIVLSVCLVLVAALKSILLRRMTLLDRILSIRNPSSVMSILLIGALIGAFLGRQWTGDLADVVVTVCILWIALFHTVPALVFFMPRLTSASERVRARFRTPPPEQIQSEFSQQWAFPRTDLGPRAPARPPRPGREAWSYPPPLNPHALLFQPICGARLKEAAKQNIAPLLFAGSLIVYAITRLFALDEFPINFFADEANQVVTAVDLAKRGFRDPQGVLFPMYFHLNAFYYPDIAVYFHVLTASLFGKSIVVARATSALLTILAAGAVGLLLKQIFRARYWWTAVLLLAMMPAWFMFSRTAFDFVTMSSLYALFLLFYLLYRYRSPRYIYLALIFGAATFYAYPMGQAAMGLLTLFLLISDLRYHWQQRYILLRAALLALVMAIPFIRFGLLFPGETAYHLRAVNSYWTQDIPLMEKIGRWASITLRTLSPGYWFLPNQPDFIRHELKGYGFMPLIELPVLLIGVVVCLRRFKESKYRALLAALVVVPVSAAVTDAAIIRVLAFVMPATIVSALGLEWLLTRIKRARSIAVTSFALFGILAGLSLGMLQDALTNGPTWYSDYTLYGMQWGAKQIFQAALPNYIETHPAGPIYVSHTWANGTDIFSRFFETSPRVQIATIDGWLEKKLFLDPNAVFIMPPNEYEKARHSPKFKNVEVEDIILYPDGRDGFYIARLEYADNADQIIAAERAALRQLVTEPVTMDGEGASLAHTKFDIGATQSMLDGDLYTLARGVEANPLVLDFKFAKPRALQGLAIYLGKTNSKVIARLYASDASPPVEYAANFRNAESAQVPAGPVAQMSFDDAPLEVTRLYLEIWIPESDETAHVHVFELKLR